jgi:hypothetical protein
MRLHRLADWAGRLGEANVRQTDAAVPQEPIRQRSGICGCHLSLFCRTRLNIAGAHGRARPLDPPTARQAAVTAWWPPPAWSGRRPPMPVLWLAAAAANERAAIMLPLLPCLFYHMCETWKLSVVLVVGGPPADRLSSGADGRLPAG